MYAFIFYKFCLRCFHPNLCLYHPKNLLLIANGTVSKNGGIPYANFVIKLFTSSKILSDIYERPISFATFVTLPGYSKFFGMYILFEQIITIMQAPKGTL